MNEEWKWTVDFVLPRKFLWYLTLTASTHSYFFLVDESNISEAEVHKNHLNTLSREQFTELCMKVKEVHSPGRLNSMATIYDAHRLWLYHINGKTEEVITRKCPTEPRTYLHMGKSDVHIKITKVDELFSRFPFHMEVVKTISGK